MIVLLFILKCFQDFDWSSGHPQDIGKGHVNLFSTVTAVLVTQTLICEITCQCLWHCQALASQDLLVTSEIMCLEAYGLDIWSQSKRARYFKLATILLTLTGLLCSHSNKLDEKFLILQAIQAAGLHFVIQSPAKQLRSAFVWHCDHRDK